MADTPKVYVLCDHNCKYESLTKEQIYTAIIEAVETGSISSVDTGFVRTIKTINNIPLKFFVGSQASYDALTDADKENLFAIISDDTSKADLLAYLDDLKSGIEGLEKKHDELVEAMFAVATYTPTTEKPLYCGDNGNGENTFTIDLPRGKTLKNLMCVMVKQLSATLVCMPYETESGMSCYGRGDTNPARGNVHAYSCKLSFTEANGVITGTVNSAYISTTKFDGDTVFLSASNAYTGSDYIRLYFY